MRSLSSQTQKVYYPVDSKKIVPIFTLNLFSQLIKKFVHQLKK